LPILEAYNFGLITQKQGKRPFNGDDVNRQE